MKATVTSKGGLNIRTEPSTGAKVARIAECGEVLEASLIHDNWCKGDEGYFMSRFVDVTDGDAAVSGTADAATAAEGGQGASEGGQGGDNAADAATAQLEAMTVPKLMVLAKESGIAVKANAKKAEIIEAIINAD